MKKSGIERQLIARFGDLHDVIPELVSLHGQVQTAVLLGVTQNWISLWLRNNGYIEVRQWVKSPEAQ